MKRIIGCICLGAASLLASRSVAAAETGPWRYRVAPYLWGAGIDGTVQHARLPVTLRPSASFGDVWSDLDFGAMMAFEAQRERHGIVADLMTVRLSTTVHAPVAGHALPIGLKAHTTTGLVAYQYRWLEQPEGYLDLVAGLRVWSARTKFGYAIPVPVPPPMPQAYDGSQQERWFDLQVGLKGRRNFANGAYVGGWVLGGKGESDLAADVMLLAGYRFSERVALSAGYRWLKTDYATSNGFRFDAALHGPGVGIEYSF